MFFPGFLCALARSLAQSLRAAFRTGPGLVVLAFLVSLLPAVDQTKGWQGQAGCPAGAKVNSLARRGATASQRLVCPGVTAVYHEAEQGR